MTEIDPCAPDAAATNQRLSAAGLAKSAATAVRTGNRDELVQLLAIADDPAPQSTADSILKQPQLYGFHFRKLPDEMVAASCIWAFAGGSWLLSAIGGLAAPADANDALSIFRYYPLIDRIQAPVAVLALVCVFFLLRRKEWARITLVVLSYAAAVAMIVFSVSFGASMWSSELRYSPVFSSFALPVVVLVGVVTVAMFLGAAWLLQRESVRSATASA